MELELEVGREPEAGIESVGVVAWVELVVSGLSMQKKSSVH